MPTLSNNNVTNLAVQTFRHAWSNQIKENIENTIFKNFEDKKFTKARNDYATYKKNWSLTLFSSAFDELKEQRRASANLLISIIHSDTFKDNILNKIKESDSIDIYFSKLFRALLNGEIKNLSNLLFNNNFTQDYEKSFMKSISLVFGLRGKTSWLRNATSWCFSSHKEMIACSKDMKNILIHLSLIRHSFKNPKNNNNINPESLIPANLKIALNSLNKMKKDVLSNNSGFDTLKENNIQKINETTSIIKKRAIAELKLAILQNFYTRISSSNTEIERYSKDYLLKEIRLYNDKSNYNETTKALLWQDQDDFKKFIKDIVNIYRILDKKVDEFFKGKINIIYDYLNDEIFNVGLECNIFTILREDLLDIITNSIKNKVSFDTSMSSNAYKESLNGLFPFQSSYDTLESTLLSSAKTRYLKYIPFGEYAFYTCELLGIQTLEDIIQRKKIESATKLSKKIIEEYEIEEHKKIMTSQDEKTEGSTEDSDCEYKIIDSQNYKLETNKDNQDIINMSTKKSSYKSAIRYNCTTFEEDAQTHVSKILNLNQP